MNPALIQNIAVFALPVLLSITLHEAAHAYAARYFGDPTAAMLGRLSLNPIKHIDLLGTIIIPIGLYFATNGSFVFGYAKPVPVMTRNLRNPKRDMMWVALAGPAANFVQALLWAVLLVVMKIINFEENFFIHMAFAGISVNLVMWAFNLFPCPPLDGGRILVGLLPWQLAQHVAKLEPYGFFIVLALVYTGIASTYWITPLMTVGGGLIGMITAIPSMF